MSVSYYGLVREFTFKKNSFRSVVQKIRKTYFIFIKYGKSLYRNTDKFKFLCEENFEEKRRNGIMKIDGINRATETMLVSLVLDMSALYPCNTLKVIIEWPGSKRALVRLEPLYNKLCNWCNILGDLCSICG